MIVDLCDDDGQYRLFFVDASPRHRGRSGKQTILSFMLGRIGELVSTHELRRLTRVAGYGRLIRDLRQEGWQISSYRDRLDLKRGEYVLESDTPLTDRTAPVDAATRMRVLLRDKFRCIICGVSNGDVSKHYPHRPVQLEVHHIIPEDQWGGREDGNLATLCNICHEGVGAEAEASAEEAVQTPKEQLRLW